MPNLDRTKGTNERSNDGTMYERKKSLMKGKEREISFRRGIKMREKRNSASPNWRLLSVCLVGLLTLLTLLLLLLFFHYNSIHIWCLLSLFLFSLSLFPFSLSLSLFLSLSLSLSETLTGKACITTVNNQTQDRQRVQEKRQHTIQNDHCFSFLSLSLSLSLSNCLYYFVPCITKDERRKKRKEKTLLISGSFVSLNCYRNSVCAHMNCELFLTFKLIFNGFNFGESETQTGFVKNLFSKNNCSSFVLNVPSEKKYTKIFVKILDLTVFYKKT